MRASVRSTSAQPPPVARAPISSERRSTCSSVPVMPLRSSRATRAHRHPNGTRGRSREHSPRSRPSPGSPKRDLVGRASGRRPASVSRPHTPSCCSRAQRSTRGPRDPDNPTDPDRGRTRQRRRNARGVRALARQPHARPQGAVPQPDHPSVRRPNARRVPSAHACLRVQLDPRADWNRWMSEEDAYVGREQPGAYADVVLRGDEDLWT